MDLGDIPRQNPDNAVREIDGSVFIMNPDTSELHQLNEVGARVWQLCQGDRSVADIAGVIEAEYDVAGDRAQADVLEFLDQLAAKGLVEIA